MSLHEQLLGLIAEYRTSAESDDYPVLFPLDALRAVVELHAPSPNYRDPSHLECDGCDWVHDGAPPWPCSTAQAIARELGIEAGEGRG